MPPDFHEMPNGRRIACRFTPGAGPTLVFLPGYMSDMAGAKAQALFDWAQTNARACLLLDYSGCGASPGDFAQGTLSRWRDEVLAVIAARVPGPVVMVGSSIGGWLMLLVALKLPPEQVAGLVGIAAAPDFTDWGFDLAEKSELSGGRTIYRANAYGPEPTPTHALFWADGQSQLLLGGAPSLLQAIALDCPVRLLHGQADTDVPWQTSLRLAGALRSAQVQVTLVKDGDHRLSRPQDVALLIANVAGLAPG
ncbi:MAG: alpha/beta hydrolase [Pseudomonadota bacterium]|nr:alpha/beta hydrolase [Pseudomonadota bacterium]